MNWDSLWQAELFLHLPKMKDENLYFTNYSMMTLLPCSQLFCLCYQCFFYLRESKKADHSQAATFKTDYKMNICYNLTKVLLPLLIPEVLPNHMSTETDVSLTYFHQMPKAWFFPRSSLKILCFSPNTVVLTIIIFNGIHKKWNLSLNLVPINWPYLNSSKFYKMRYCYKYFESKFP